MRIILLLIYIEKSEGPSVNWILYLPPKKKIAEFQESLVEMPKDSIKVPSFFSASALSRSSIDTCRSTNAKRMRILNLKKKVHELKKKLPADGPSKVVFYPI